MLDRTVLGPLGQGPNRATELAPLLRAGRVNSEQAQQFANAWVAAWNAHDVEAVLSYFSDQVTFTSPVARRILDGSDGVIHGKEALRAYWREGLRRYRDLRLELVGIYVGIDTVVLNYRNQTGTLVSEVLRFDGTLIIEGHGTYLAEM